jgi:hypothetical protein
MTWSISFVLWYSVVPFQCLSVWNVAGSLALAKARSCESALLILDGCPEWRGQRSQEPQANFFLFRLPR